MKKEFNLTMAKQGICCMCKKKSHSPETSYCEKHSEELKERLRKRGEIK